MKWISIKKANNGQIIINSHLGERRAYWLFNKKEAELEYRREFGLRYTPLAKIND